MLMMMRRRRRIGTTTMMMLAESWTIFVIWVDAGMEYGCIPFDKLVGHHTPVITVGECGMEFLDIASRDS